MQVSEKAKAFHSLKAWGKRSMKDKGHLAKRNFTSMIGGEVIGRRPAKVSLEEGKKQTLQKRGTEATVR